MHSSMQNTLELSISALKSIYVDLNQCPAHLGDSIEYKLSISSGIRVLIRYINTFHEY